MPLYSTFFLSVYACLCLSVFLPNDGTGIIFHYKHTYVLNVQLVPVFVLYTPRKYRRKGFLHRPTYLQGSRTGAPVWQLSSSQLCNHLKGQCHEISTSGFLWINFPQAPGPVRSVSNFLENSRRYSQLKVHHRCPVSLTQVPNRKFSIRKFLHFYIFSSSKFTSRCQQSDSVPIICHRFCWHRRQIYRRCRRYISVAIFRGLREDDLWKKKLLKSRDTAHLVLEN